MKKIKNKLSLIMVLAFVFTMVIGSAAFGDLNSPQQVDAYSGVKVFYNNSEVIHTDQPFIINDRTYVPLRMIMELMGSDVTWDEANYRVLLTGQSSADKDAEIAALKKQITQLENEIAGLDKSSGGDLSDIEADLQDIFEDAGDEYFDDDEIKVTLNLSGDEDDIAYTIKLDFGSKSDYDNLSEVDKDDIESFLVDVEEELTDAVDGTDYEYADITGKLSDADDSKLYVKYNGSSYTYSWGTDDLSDIEDDVNYTFRNAGYQYFGDSDITVAISLSGDEDDILYDIVVNARSSTEYDSDDKIDKSDLLWLEDDVADEIEGQIDGTDFEDADISGGYSVKY